MNKLYPEKAIQDIADAIRHLLGVDTKYTVSQMADAINSYHNYGLHGRASSIFNSSDVDDEFTSQVSGIGYTES